MSGVESLTRQFVSGLDYEVADFEDAVWAELHRPPPPPRPLPDQLMSMERSVCEVEWRLREHHAQARESREAVAALVVSVITTLITVVLVVVLRVAMCTRTLSGDPSTMSGGLRADWKGEVDG